MENKEDLLEYQKLLIVVDMQNDFVTGSLANEEAVKAIANIKNEMDSASAILFTRDTHGNEEEYLSSLEGCILPIHHCEKDTHGWQVVKELDDYARSKEVPVAYVDKDTFGDYGLPETINDFIETLPHPFVRDIVIVGTCTDICVVSNALILKSYFVDYPRITVREDACAGTTVENHKSAISVMKSCQIFIQ